MINTELNNLKEDNCTLLISFLVDKYNTLYLSTKDSDSEKPPQL